MPSAVVLIGSPRGEKSTSMNLGTYLLGKLREKGWETTTHFIGKTMNSISDIEGTVTDMEGAELVILATPLYVDSLPSPVVQFMELYGIRYAGVNGPNPRMCLIINGDFPEDQNQVGVQIVRHFATDMGMEWAGALSMGQGAAIWGEGLEDLGRRTRHIRSALDQAASALAEARAIPSEAERMFGKRFIPAFLYRYMSNKGWDASAKRNKVRNLKARPFLRDRPPQAKDP
jgi:multimeric flavodoxin WrbA